MKTLFTSALLLMSSLTEIASAPFLPGANAWSALSDRNALGETEIPNVVAAAERLQIVRVSRW